MLPPPASVLAVAVACAFALGACTGGDPEPTPPPVVTAPTGPSGPTPTGAPPSPSASPIPEPSHLRLPPDAPAVVDDPGVVALIADGDLGALAPPGARVTFSEVDTDPFDQITLGWERGDDPFAAERGVVVWQTPGDDPAWRAVYAFTDRPREGVLGIQQPQRGDLTADRVDELVTFEDRGGSGACGTVRVISPVDGAADEIYRRETCDAETSIVGATLRVREAVYGPDDPHCCPSAFRTSTLEWDGERFVETDVVEESTG